MGSQLSKYFESGSHTGTLATFILKSLGPFPCTFLTKWTKLTKGNLEYQQPLWGTFEIPKLNFLETRLDYNSSDISRTEWNAYFDWYFEASP